MKLNIKRIAVYGIKYKREIVFSYNDCIVYSLTFGTLLVP